MIESVNLPPSAHTIQCTLQHIATLCILQPTIQCTSSAHTAAAITSSVHTAANHPVHIQCTHTAAAITSLEHTAANHPVHIQCTHTAAAITSLEHTAANLQCTLQPCTAICSQPSVHTAANCSHLQPSTLQLYYPVHTAAILSSAHCSYTIQCTLQLQYLYSTSSAPLNHHRVSLYHYWPTSRAVNRH